MDPYRGNPPAEVPGTSQYYPQMQQSGAYAPQQYPQGSVPVAMPVYAGQAQGQQTFTGIAPMPPYPAELENRYTQQQMPAYNQQQRVFGGYNNNGYPNQQPGGYPNYQPNYNPGGYPQQQPGAYGRPGMMGGGYPAPPVMVQQQQKPPLDDNCLAKCCCFAFVLYCLGCVCD